MSFMLKSPKEIAQEIAKRVKTMRLKQNLTQQGLSERSGVSLGSLKRFENTGEISLKSLIHIAVSLGDSNSFEQLFVDDISTGSLFNIKEDKPRQRGRKK